MDAPLTYSGYGDSVSENGHTHIYFSRHSYSIYIATECIPTLTTVSDGIVSDRVAVVTFDDLTIAW